MADNLTNFQKLFYLFGQGGPKQSNYKKYELKTDDLIVTKSREEYEKQKLSLQQQHYQESQWAKVDSELYQKAVFYETTRLASYMDFEAMEFCLAGETKIATPNGFKTIEELANKGRDYEFITYAYDHNLKKVVPAKARNAHYTRDEMTYKVIFDDDSEIIATWEHRLMKRDGTFCKVKDLKEGDSMMPFYRKSFFNNKNYNWVYTCNGKEGHNGWVPEHDIIAEWVHRPKKENEEVHHIDFNGKNNNPENLLIMNMSEHRAYHARHNNKKLWANPEYRKKMLEVSRRTDNKHRWNGTRSGKNNPAYFPIPWDNIIETAKKIKTLKGTSKVLGVSHTKLQREITYNGYKDWLTFLEAYGIEKSKYATSRSTGDKLKINHKIKSIEPYKVIPVYDLTVPGYKNFATDTIFSHNTPEMAATLDIISEESCLVGSTKIPLLNGKKTTIKELYDNKDSNFWVYGVDINENTIKPSIVDSVIFKGYKKVYKVLLDDDTEIICTDNHKWLTYDNRWVETKNLNKGSSLKSIYRKLNHKGYERVSLDGGKLKLTHQIVSENSNFKEKEYLKDNNPTKQRIVVHHKSFDKLNNEPNQLTYMLWDEHQKLHTNLNKERWEDEEFSHKMKKIFSETAKKTWRNYTEEEREERNRKQSKTNKKNIKTLSNEERIQKFSRKGTNNGMYGVRRFGVSNPNYNHEKNHLDTINEGEYINTIINKRVSRNKLLEEKFNLTKQSIKKYNKYLCEKYKINRIEDIDFMFIDGYSIKYIKEFISTKHNPYRQRKAYCDKYGLDVHQLNRFLKKRGYSSWSDLVNTVGNHRVVSVTYHGIEPVYDLVNSSVDNSFGVECNNGMIISHNCTLSEQGKIVNIYSDSSRVKSVLEDLFFNILDTHTNLPMWTRNTCKYGDNFVYLKIHNKEGIIGVTQLPNIEINREESGMFNHVNGTDIQSTSPSTKKEVKFRWKDKNIEFNAWEIAHFRLLGDDRKLPYGTSILEKARRIWKQLLLAEDAMLVYRVTRAPERRVFKVFVGNIDDDDVEAYVQKVANKFKRTQTADNQTGQTDIRYNTLAVDQDFFVPVRDENASIPIETLNGASNLDQIADIEYIQRKLLTALRVPKPFLGFEEQAGDGKNLALQDIRFARTINRIQQSMIQELNKIAIIHLYILGFHDEITNFKLTLNNPSTQGEMLKVEQWKEKVMLYKDLVSAVDGGIAPTSHTWAKKEIFNWSDDEIKLDLEQQRLERAASAELEATPEIIKTTGFFTKIDKLYGEMGTSSETNGEEGGEEGDMGGDFGGGGGSFGGGGGLDFGDEGGDFGDEGGDFGDFGDEGGEDLGGEDLGGDFGESFNQGVVDKLLYEGFRKNEDILMMTKGIDDLIKNELGDDTEINED